MPIVRSDNLKQFPEASKIAGMGIARYTKGDDAGVELHFHDGEELWVLVEGCIRAQYDGREITLRSGDTLLTMPGVEHAILEVVEDSVLVWIEQNLQGQMRPGHLHRPEDPWP